MENVIWNICRNMMNGYGLVLRHHSALLNQSQVWIDYYNLYLLHFFYAVAPFHRAYNHDTVDTVELVRERLQHWS